MSFSRLAPKLVGLRIVALDSAGHGHSAYRAEGANYLPQDYMLGVLMVAEQSGWEQFSLSGHPVGAIISVLLIGTLPGHVERLALINGLIPYTGEASKTPQKLGEALRAQLTLRHRRRPVYAEPEEAVKMRIRGIDEISREATELLAQRGLEPMPSGYIWHIGTRLTLPSPLCLTQTHALNFVRNVECPVSLVLAKQGMLMVEPRMRALLEALLLERHHLPGRHYLHLDDEAGTQAAAGVFATFFAR